MEINILDYIGQPVGLVKKKLEDQGYKVNVIKNSLSKIKTDYELVVSVIKKENRTIELIVGEFLINIEKYD